MALHVNSPVELNPDGLHCVPSVRRRSPNCFTALVEASAHSEFGIPSISKAWFSHSFIYERPGARVELMEDNRTLRMLFASDLSAENALQAKLLHYFGIALHEDTFDGLGAVLDAIARALKAGKLVISPFGACFMKDTLDYGRDYARLGHLISPIRLDVARGKLFAIENMCGSVEISLDEYAQCFAAHRELGVPFKLMQCRRAPNAVERALGARELRRDLGACLRRLFSAGSGEGLTALRSGVADIVDAAERYRAPLRVHRLWSFSHDRSAVEESLVHWAAARAASTAELTQLGALLKRAAAAWHGLYALIQSEPSAWTDETLDDVHATAQAVVTLEERIAEQLQEIYAGLCSGSDELLAGEAGARSGADP